MRVNSCYKGREFESPHRIPTGWTFFQLSFCCKVCNVCLKKTKINEKEAVVGPCFEKRRKELVQQFLSHFWADVDIHVHSTLVIMNDSLSLSLSHTNTHTHPHTHTWNLFELKIVFRCFCDFALTRFHLLLIIQKQKSEKPYVLDVWFRRNLASAALLGKILIYGWTSQGLFGDVYSE